MKTKLALLAVGALLLAAPALRAQTTNTNSIPLTQTVGYQTALENDRSLGERALLPPGLKEKMRLTDDQRAELKTIEDEFAVTSLQYQMANEPRISAALEAERQARAINDPGQIQVAREQLQQVWAGLQSDRDTAIIHVRPLLTPDQIIILDDPKNKWHESHGHEANDPSAN